MRFGTIAAVLVVFSAAGYGYASLFTSSRAPVSNRVMKSWPTFVDGRRVVMAPPIRKVRKVARQDAPKETPQAAPQETHPVKTAAHLLTNNAVIPVPVRADRTKLAAVSPKLEPHPIALPARKPVLLIAAVAEEKVPVQVVADGKQSSDTASPTSAPVLAAVEDKQRAIPRTTVAALKVTTSEMVLAQTVAASEKLHSAAWPQNEKTQARPVIADLQSMELNSDQQLVRPSEPMQIRAVIERPIEVASNDSAGNRYSNIVTGSITLSDGPDSEALLSHAGPKAGATVEKHHNRLEIVAARRSYSPEVSQQLAYAAKWESQLAAREGLQAKASTRRLDTPQATTRLRSQAASQAAKTTIAVASNALPEERATAHGARSNSLHPFLKPIERAESHAATDAPPLPAKLLRQSAKRTAVASFVQRRRRLMADRTAVIRPRPHARKPVAAKRAASRKKASKIARRRTARRAIKSRHARASALRRRAALKRQRHRARQARLYKRKRRARRFRSYRQFQAYRNRAIANQIRRRRYYRGIY